MTERRLFQIGQNAQVTIKISDDVSWEWISRVQVAIQENGKWYYRLEGDPSYVTEHSQKWVPGFPQERLKMAGM